LVIFPDRLTQEGQKELFAAYRAAGVDGLPYRLPYGHLSDEARTPREEEDKKLDLLRAQVQHKYPKWSHAAAHFLVDCATVANGIVPQELWGSFDPRKSGRVKRYFRTCGPFLRSREHYDMLMDLVYKKYEGGKEAWDEQVAKVMWNAHTVVGGSIQRQQTSRRRKKREDERAAKAQAYLLRDEAKSGESDEEAEVSTAEGPLPRSDAAAVHPNRLTEANAWQFFYDLFAHCLQPEAKKVSPGSADESAGKLGHDNSESEEEEEEEEDGSDKDEEAFDGSGSEASQFGASEDGGSRTERPSLRSAKRQLERELEESEVGDEDSAEDNQPETGGEQGKNADQRAPPEQLLGTRAKRYMASCHGVGYSLYSQNLFDFLLEKDKNSEDTEEEEI